MDNNETNKITCVEFWWDEVSGNDGWYAQAFDKNGVVADSMKAWFPVDLDDWPDNDEDAAFQIYTALSLVFTMATIIRRDQS